MQTTKPVPLTAETDELHGKLIRLRQGIESVFFGKSEAIRQLLVGLIGRGHVLIEDVPGVGKTVLARVLSRSIACSFARIQLTPDLLPSDILGVSIYNDKAGLFDFKRGPIFANVVLADEVNRTTPRTQSALLEAMNEYQVTVDGQTLTLDQPFLVIATQNPFEFEGTYFLPESQLDRFMLRIRIGYPDRNDERRILREQPGYRMLDAIEPVMDGNDVLALQRRVETVRVDDAILDYIQDIVDETRKHDGIEVGVSPRGALALTRAVRAAALLAGRDYAVPDDVKSLAKAVCAHRVVSKSYLHDGRTTSNDQLIDEVLLRMRVPD